MADARFCLEWDSHSRNICTGLSSLQQNGEFVDMTLAADGHHVKVHQMVLALASPYLKELIASANCPHPVIFLNKVSYKTLCSILEYIYMGQTMVTVNDINDLITAAKDLHIKGLEDVKTSEGIPTTEPETNMDDQSAENPEIQIKLQQPVTSLPHISKLSSLKRKNDIGSLKSIQSNMPLRKRINKTNTESIESTQELPDLTNEGIDNDASCDDPLDRDDDSNDFNDTDNSNVSKQVTHSDTAQMSLQYTVSNQGSLQLVLNRFLYSLYYQYKDRSRQWRCVDNRNNKCTASVFTKDDIVVRRVSAHTHAFHDHKILKKVVAGCVYSALQDAEAECNTVQFTVSNQGSIQIIVNRFVYFWRYTYRDGARQWRCIDSRRGKCPAQLITGPDNLIRRRVKAHIHPFHDHQILKKVNAGCVYSAMKDAQNSIKQRIVPFSS